MYSVSRWSTGALISMYMHDPAASAPIAASSHARKQLPNSA